MHTVEVATRDDRHRTTHALTCIAGVTADWSRCWCVGKLRTTVTESFLVGFLQTSHPHLGYYNSFATVYLFLKSDKNWLQTKPAKTTKSLSFGFERSHLKLDSTLKYSQSISYMPRGVLLVWKTSFNLKTVLKKAFSLTSHAAGKETCKTLERYSIPEQWTFVGAERCLKTFAKRRWRVQWAMYMWWAMYVQWAMYMWLYTWRAHGCGCHIRHEARFNCLSRACD